MGMVLAPERGGAGAQGTTRDDMAGLAHLEEFNEIVGFEEKMATEERLTRNEGAKLHVKVRAPAKELSN